MEKNMNIEGVFYFEFSWDDLGNNDETEYKSYGFTITVVPEKQHLLDFANNQCIKGHIDFQEDVYLDADLEEYGVHDWGSYPVPGVPAIGYHSYEVEPKNYLTLMMEWSKYLGGLFGRENIGPVVSINTVDKDDGEVLLEVKSKSQEEPAADTRLEDLCRQFIADYKIRGHEDIYQDDRVIENACEFLEEIFDVVGYYTDDEDDDVED